eukprot:scaffold6045_cov188-Prasinococcus_capsulatus_cf.AAC.5
MRTPTSRWTSACARLAASPVDKLHTQPPRPRLTAAPRQVVASGSMGQRRATKKSTRSERRAAAHRNVGTASRSGRLLHAKPQHARARRRSPRPHAALAAFVHRPVGVLRGAGRSRRAARDLHPDVG